MKKQFIKAIVIKPSSVEIKELKDDYKVFKKEINIDSPITVVDREIGGKMFSIWCDDEGLFKPDLKATAFCSNAHEMLAGGLIVTNLDGEGNTASLTDSDIECIKKCIFKVIKDGVFDYNTSIGTLKMSIKEGDFILRYEV